MPKFACLLLILPLGLLSACMATKIVTVPVKVAYGTTKVVVKGTGKAIGAVIPDDEDERSADKN
ncbi:NF038104 family lipoprotein [Alkanindiges sp. WGS2144]|uniref:NF038104 family lipoprotein n=1 Tax=Alkanindiges sp. WGS2144 TaxID=3366808 RepID=UPI00375284E7